MDPIGLLFSQVFHDYNSLKFIHVQGLKNRICKFDYNVLNIMQTVQRFGFQFAYVYKKYCPTKFSMYFSNKIPYNAILGDF